MNVHDQCNDSSTIWSNTLLYPWVSLRYIMVGDLTRNIAPTLGILKSGLSNALVCPHMEREGDTEAYRWQMHNIDRYGCTFSTLLLSILLECSPNTWLQAKEMHTLSGLFALITGAVFHVCFPDKARATDFTNVELIICYAAALSWASTLYQKRENVGIFIARQLQWSASWVAIVNIFKPWVVPRQWPVTTKRIIDS